METTPDGYIGTKRVRTGNESRVMSIAHCGFGKRDFDQRYELAENRWEVQISKRYFEEDQKINGLVWLVFLALLIPNLPLLAISHPLLQIAKTPPFTLVQDRFLLG